MTKYAYPVLKTWPRNLTLKKYCLLLPTYWGHMDFMEKTAFKNGNHLNRQRK